MPDPLYRIKPLVWTKHETRPIWRSTNGPIPLEIEGDWSREWYVLYERGRSIAGFRILEDAQAAANEHNRQQMLPGLEEVK